MRNCSAFALCAENFAFSLLTRTEDRPLIYFFAQSTKTLQLDEQCTLPSDFDAATTELDLPSKGGNKAQRQAHARRDGIEVPTAHAFCCEDQDSESQQDRELEAL